ncbi:hypothetical protein [Sinorhizobium terangae]|uniref:hypothetical protein n=1 Tax=Sinorhizobium terangae TaxID=110322 RepID=UPI0024B1C03F|nr:hypothetical protein [Sinorhizobium terangae]WFU49137.1 hypothetical protein QA637_06990 [Sinorhizobium terangae]
MIHYIVVEGESDAKHIRAIVPDDLVDKVVIVPAGKRNSAIPLAKSIALAKQAPVALIMDAGTEDDDLVRDQELGFEDFVAMLPISSPLRLFLGVPTIVASLDDVDWESEIVAFLRDDGTAPRPTFAYRP